MADDLRARIEEQLRHRPWTALATVALVFLIGGYALRGGGPRPVPSTPDRRVHDASGEAAQATEATLYTCSMHPHIRSEEPGRCPICGMELVSVETGASGRAASGEGLTLTPEAAALARVETRLVERRAVAVELRLVGTIAYDQTQVRTVSAWLPGRIDRLYVDYVGVPVSAGDHVGELYGPDLLASQRELIEAKRAVRRAAKGSPALRSAAQSTLDAARERFRLWGFTPEQIRTLERQGQASDHMTIFSPIAGVVIEKAVDEGSYVGEGDAIVRIADLSNLWLVMPAYESDIRWLRYGQRVEFEVAALPGERFEGRVSFVSPVLDPKTRTVEVRVNLDNTEGRLKPEMFARARVQVQVRDDGRVVEASLEDKWIGPMHREIVSDEPGVCPICGMDLVPAETLGYEISGRPPLVIPMTAPLITGERAIVYVAHFDERETRYEGREVRLGPRAGSDYVVLDGLREGERVVTRGAFKIDSSLQIQAQPSMMNPEPEGAEAGHVHMSEEP